MDDLEDELDLRFHKGLNPDVYYRCPTSESFEGALRNELDKNAASFIPTDVVTEFIFATASTTTIPVTQQPNLDALIQPADHPQSTAAEYALCRDIDGKDRLKVQRAIARYLNLPCLHNYYLCNLDLLSKLFRTLMASERSAQNKEGGDGARFKYVCQDSFQNRDRKSNTRKGKSLDSDDGEPEVKKQGPVVLPTYDCGGAIHIKFSLKRDAVNVVYKHNPIHTTREADNGLPALMVTDNGVAATADATEEKQPRKRKRSKQDETEAQSEFRGPDLDMSTSPEGPNPSAKRKSKKGSAVASSTTSRKTSTKKTKARLPASPTGSREKAPFFEEPPLPTHIRGKACIRCREKKIKCNESKPSCNQCRRGLWTCQYEVIISKKRSKNGCLNCKQRRRKCTEMRPSRAHCLRLDDDCEYAD
ncbi:hypothetical protein AG0111_0g4203 [Alternaria gaisen]|uniref:Uncharacterized protein n=1 Tax=Alternaria gaisen TaxID=167740 RepID=A0ACB6FSL3_9PLEO|nr:hypothetical protein AG0111_0g4203 [Alternaria gaisen]